MSTMQSPDNGSGQSKGQSTATPTASTGQSDASTEGQSVRTFTKTEYDKMQSKKDKEIAELRASHRAAENRVTILEDANESLKDKLVSLQSEVDQGIPDDVKEIRSQIQKREEALRKAERDYKKERSQWDADLAERDGNERKSLAQTLADKYGVDVSVLNDFDSPEKMKAYALDNMDPTKFASPAPGETSTSTKTEAKPPIVPAGTGGGGTSLRDLSPEDRVTKGLQKIAK